MGIVNLSVPDEIKRASIEAFADQNKSANVAELMLEAVAEREKMQRRAGAIDSLLELRAQRPFATQAEIRAAREELREWP